VENLLARDIKNLVGRAGRAGATTKGLVICANPQQWSLVEPVAQQQPGERVAGALHELIGRLRNALRQQNVTLTNEILEGVTQLHTLIDGIDATLIDLVVEELGEDELVRIAGDLSGQTFAARQAELDSLALMREVFELRARRMVAIRAAGRLGWIRETGTRTRMLDSVELSLLPLRETWDDITTPTDPELIDALLTWAWDLPEMKEAVAVKSWSLGEVALLFSMTRPTLASETVSFEGHVPLIVWACLVVYAGAGLFFIWFEIRSCRRLAQWPH
jgi:hypothetical protein